jgi:hypothetical protein
MQQIYLPFPTSRPAMGLTVTEISFAGEQSDRDVKLIISI